MECWNCIDLPLNKHELITCRTRPLKARLNLNGAMADFVNTIYMFGDIVNKIIRDRFSNH